MARPEPGWYVASGGGRRYIVIVPHVKACPTVAVYVAECDPVTYTYPNPSEKDFPWHEYTLEKLNDSSSSS